MLVAKRILRKDTKYTIEEAIHMFNVLLTFVVGICQIVISSVYFAQHYKTREEDHLPVLCVLV